MNTNKLTIYGDSVDKKHITELLSGCERALGFESKSLTVYALCTPDEQNKVHEGTECVVLMSKDASLVPEGVKKLTYSADDNRADVSALNVQVREHSTSFEILYESHMGRIYSPNGSKYSRDQILVTAAVLCACDVAIDKILLTINEILK